MTVRSLKVLSALIIFASSTPAVAANGKISEFVGTYDCPNGPSFELTYDAYTMFGEKAEKITKTLPVENGIILTLYDGYRFGIWKVAASVYEWTSSDTGDSFSCSKVK